MGRPAEPGRRQRSRSTQAAEVAGPVFEHDQWTFEGQVERLGAFSSGVTRARGWKRAVGVLLIVAMLAPMVLVAVLRLLQLAV